MNIIRKVHAEKRNGLTFVLSDETLDRMGDVIKADGWDLSNFTKNPIALFGHLKDFVIGKWNNLRVEGKALLGDLQPAPRGTSPRVDEIVSLVDADILRAVSVGFRQIKAEPLDPKEPFGGLRFLRQELVECSVVAVPANPNALAVAKSLNISDDVRKLVFAEHGTKHEEVKPEPDIMDEFITVRSACDEWTPNQAHQVKMWMVHMMKAYPFNPIYNKLHRLMDEIETVRTISLVSAEHGKKGRAS